MSCSRLVIVEGIPGSGKTSSAHFIADWFRQNGRAVRLYLEGAPDHPAEAVAHVLNAVRFLKPLRPALIYLDPPSIYDAHDTVAGVRPREWLDHVIAYPVGQGWLRGFDGMARFYEARRRLEIGMFPELQRLGFHVLWVNNAGRDWEHDYARIRSFLYDICPPN